MRVNFILSKHIIYFNFLAQITKWLDCRTSLSIAFSNAKVSTATFELKIVFNHRLNKTLKLYLAMVQLFYLPLLSLVYRLSCNIY